jgi:predicted CXXCH cytochrome family protein
MKRLLLAILFSSQIAAGGGTSVVGSRHDLSVTGPGPIRAEQERQVCVFCHISHAAGDKLSSRPTPPAAPGMRAYESSTARTRAGAVSGASRACLSCHDGTISVGDTRHKRIRTAGVLAGGRLPSSSPSNLGTDLRRSHPISIPMKLEHKTRRRGGSYGEVAPDASGQIQCTSCHDPHAEYAAGPEGMFLRDTMRGSALCTRCHDTFGASSHASSAAQFGSAKGNTTGFATVAEAGCSACHRAHGADARGRLLARGDKDDDDALCLRCHSGDVARLNISADLSKPYSHRVGAGQHDESEGPKNPAHPLPETSATTPRHAACVDCHDPHEANGDVAVAPDAGGPLAGVWGIDHTGALVKAVAYQYEVCFKCHGDSANQPAGRQATGLSAVRRAAADVNLRRVFAPDAPSSHPIVAQRGSGTLPGLILPKSSTGVIFCTDCHASDSAAAGGAPRGPHGSIYPHLLERSYSTAAGTQESSAAYALCYKCHDRATLLSDGSNFKSLHRTHVVDQHEPCSACHAAHGVSSRYGTASHNAHLVDFDLSMVKTTLGIPAYTSNGTGSGNCTLVCHDTHAHEARSY